MGWFQDNIFNLYFTATNKQLDPNKDVNGKGTLERFNEVVGADIDANIVPLINNLLINIYIAASCFDQYVPFLESMLGYDAVNNVLYFDTTLYTRRKLLKYFLRWCNLRGTARCYQLLFNMLGITMVLAEQFPSSSFDAPQELDNVDTPFDSQCPTCSSYTLVLSGLAPMTPQLYSAIISIITFNNPINAILASVTYNTMPLVLPSGDFSGDYNNDFNNTYNVGATYHLLDGFGNIIDDGAGNELVTQ